MIHISNIDIKKVWPFVVHKSKKPYDIYIGRPSVWGNRWSSKDSDLAEFLVESHAEAIKKHEEWVRSQPEMMAMIKRELKGKVLGCFCVPRICHGHTLAWIANFENEYQVE